MANAVIGYDNQIESATLSTSGSWSPSVDVLKTKYLYQKALATGSANIVINLGSAKPIGVVGLAGIDYSTSTSGTVTVEASASSGFGTLLFTQSVSITNVSNSVMVDVGSNITAQYWRITITMASFGIGRVFIGKRFQPTVNISYGASFGYQSNTEITESQSGYDFFYEKPTRRVIKVIYDMLTDSEATTVDNMIYLAGLSNEMAFIRDPEDTANAQRRNIYGRLSALNPIDLPYFDTASTGFDIIEMVA